MEGSNTVIDNRPSVKVFYDCDHLSEADFVSVLLGIEEEGIPYDVVGGTNFYARRETCT